MEEVKSLTGLSRSGIISAVKTGRFPVPVRLLERSFGWRHSELWDWIENRRLRNQSPKTDRSASEIIVETGNG